MRQPPEEREHQPEEAMHHEDESVEPEEERERSPEVRMHDDDTAEPEERRVPEVGMRGEGETAEPEEQRMPEASTPTGPETPAGAAAPTRTYGPTDRESPTSVMSTPDAGEYIRRFEVFQAEFIDEPRTAVEKVESLVSEAVDRMMSALKEELHGSHGQGDGEETERLRLAMKRYRDILYSFSDKES